VNAVEPQRIRRQRTKGWKRPEYAVIVDRTSRFGNPFTVEDAIEDDPALTDTEARERCTSLFEQWLEADIDAGPAQASNRRRARILADLHTLTGKDLCCPCPEPDAGQPDHCHAAVLMRWSSDPKRTRAGAGGGA
jgi:hypothetical protein